MKPGDMIALPAPLTPADCNLQDFTFMPLDVARLRDSDLAAYQAPEACWAAVLLWAAAWHQVPAASLPDDDRFLAKAAGYGRVVNEWMKVREGALHGWIKCADGRLYHPVVAQKAMESWRAKLHHAWKKECDRIRKANKQRESEGKPSLPFPPEPMSETQPIPQESEGVPSESRSHSEGTDETDAGNPRENALKGQGEGQGQGELTSKATTPDGVVVASQAGNLSASRPQPAARPECPHQQIIALYHELLPECPQVRDWTPARQQQLRARWNEDPRRQNLGYWRQFFEYVKKCGFLVGRGAGDRPFVADLEWLTKSKNFTKIREGKYE